MKETFIPKTFGPKHQRIIDTANEIMRNYRAQGYDLSLRQLYYQFVSHHAHLLNDDPRKQNTEQSYKMIGGVISDARDAGKIDWNYLVDRGRSISDYDWGYDDPADALRQLAENYKETKWETQPYKIFVMVEKQALEGVLLPVCQRWKCVFGSNKGYSSSSAMYNCGKRIQRALSFSKKIQVIYLGDHDPSGIDMTRDVESRLLLYSGAGYWNEEEKTVERYDEYDEERFEVIRVALNMDQVIQYGPPPNPAKLTDTRAIAYIAEHGTESWELDALEPSVLADLVESYIEDVIDQEAWDDEDRHEERNKSYLLKTADEYIEPDEEDDDF